MSVFVGLDWGGSSHAVCLLDGTGKVIDHFAVGHDHEGLADLVARLRRHLFALRQKLVEWGCAEKVGRGNIDG